MVFICNREMMIIFSIFYIIMVTRKLVWLNFKRRKVSKHYYCYWKDQWMEKVWFCELKTFVHVVCARVWMNSSELIPYATLYCMRKFLWPCHTYRALPSGKFVLKAAAGLVNHVKSINWYFWEIPCWVKTYITKEL